MFLLPSKILFSQNSISCCFGLKTEHRGKPIGATLDDLCENRCTVDDIKQIKVVEYGDKFMTCDNRRLWVFQNLERLGKCGEISVKVVNIRQKRWKKDTTNGGKHVEILGTSPGGVWYLKNVENIYKPMIQNIGLLPNKERILVVAIDIGMIKSGYAFSYKLDFLKDPLKSMINQWTTSVGMATCSKASTCILFDANENFVCFGFDAENKYTQLQNEGKHVQCFFFKHFKHILYNKKFATRKTQIKDDNGKTMSAIKVFSELIKYLKNHAMQTCRDVYTGINKDNIHWVLTVPDSWDETATEFMKEAAAQAGISPLCTSLVPESLAASLYCQHIPELIENDTSTPVGSLLESGTKYMVLDAGGKTDITVHVTRSTKEIGEIYKAGSGPWGGMLIDDAFRNFLNCMFGDRTMKTFTKKCGADYLELFRAFERKQKQIHATDGNQRVTFKIPVSLFETYKKEMGKVFRVSPAQKNEYHVSFSGDKLRVQTEQMKAVLSETCDHIVTQLKGVVCSIADKGVNTILMVGGLQSSKLLQHAIQKEFPNMCIITPEDPDVAVLKGAVIFGHDPRVPASMTLME